jgi:hypothetical protein
MAEAYECDRCGALHDGGPAFELVVMDGISRSRPEDGPGDYAMNTPQAPSDLCVACHNDLKRWYTDGGGDREDVITETNQ